ncbi:MAG: EamA family transporter [Chloroflexota bacterium]
MEQQVREIQPKRTDFVLLNFTMLLLAVPSLFAKLIDLSPQVIVFGRSLLAAFALFAFLQIGRQSIALRSSQDRNRIFLLGVLMAVHWVAIVQSIQVSTVAIGMIAVHTHPIITILLEPWFFNERFRWSDLLLGIIVLIGVVILVPELAWSNSTALGVFWGVVSATFFALRNVISRGYVRQYSGTLVMFYQMIAVAAVLLPTLVFVEIELSEFFSWRMFALGIIFTAGTHTLYISAMRSMKAKTTGVISVAQVPYSIVYAMIFLGEFPDWRALVGGTIILGIVVIENFRAN